VRSKTTTVVLAGGKFFFCREVWQGPGGRLPTLSHRYGRGSGHRRMVVRGAWPQVVEAAGSGVFAFRRRGALAGPVSSCAAMVFGENRRRQLVGQGARRRNCLRPRVAGWLKIMRLPE